MNPKVPRVTFMQRQAPPVPRLAAFFFGLLFVVAGLSPAHASRAVVTKSTEVMLDGQVAGRINVGQTVLVLGQSDTGTEVLISAAQEGGEPLVGLVPADAILNKSEIQAPQPDRRERAQEDAPPVETPAGAAEQDPFHEHRVWTAAELAEFMRDNRNRFSEFKGKKIRLTGKVLDAKAAGRGESTKVQAGLATPPAMQKLRVEFSTPYLLGQSFRERFGFEKRHMDYTPSTSFRNTREGVSAQVVWEYKQTLSSASGRRTYEWEYKNESAWVPVIAANSNITVSGVLHDSRFEIVLVDAELVD